MAEQPKIINLKCPNCGGPLEIYDDMDRFACGHCGSEQIAERRGGTVRLKLVVDAVARVQVGTDKTAAELALVRLDRELTTARAQGKEADACFCRLNKPSLPLANAIIKLSAIAFLVTLICFSIAVGGAPLDVGLMILSILFAGGAIVVLIWAVKANEKAQKRYNTQRGELWSPHERQIERLQMQIKKERITCGSLT